ncbi:LPS-assembly lipoprotein LptE [Cellvibrio sp. OA-2007]|uniref:LPS-assembly lipoprotein LptE n=1 Tax=Cellvibrio sp. OA-2007 TaxID=529823 RepID=UPI00078284AB|nr:LPS assembly lipoprotein LptE [Cellvibrio sp. OA-2007]
MKKIIVSLLVLSLSACGWHLRGSATGEDKLAMTSPLDLVIATKDDHSPLINALRQSLPGYKINELTSATANTLTLNLSREVLDKRTAGVGSDALTSAYEIILRVDYSVSNAQGVITPRDTNARISRTYNYNVNNANGAAQEEELVLREMRRELANSILRRVKNLSVKAPATSAAP